MTEEEQETIVNEALRKFVEYLNMWNSEYKEEHTYKVEDFTTPPYGETNWRVLEEPNKELAFPTGLIKINAADGDEGGGSQLYVGLEGYPNANGIRIEWIVHIFDLTPVMMYTAEKGFEHTP